MVCLCSHRSFLCFFFFFFNDTATTEIYTLSLHDALPILMARLNSLIPRWIAPAEIAELIAFVASDAAATNAMSSRSEEHTSELQSPCNLVCRLLLEKKKKNQAPYPPLDHRPITLTCSSVN